MLSHGELRFRSLRFSWTAVAMFAVAAALAFVATAVYRSQADAVRTPAALTPLIAPRWSLDHPLPFGTPSTLDATRKDFPGLFALPNDPAASASTLGAVWSDTSTSDSGAVDNVVALVFPNSRVEVEYEYPIQYDPQARYSAFVKDYPANGASVSSVGEWPALFVQPNSDATGANAAMIEFAAHGEMIRVMGYQSLDTLSQIATSLSDNLATAQS